MQKSSKVPGIIGVNQQWEEEREEEEEEWKTKRGCVHSVGHTSHPPSIQNKVDGTINVGLQDGIKH